MKLTLPQLFYVKAFWESLSYAVAGIIGILYLLGLVPLTWVLAPASLFSMFLATLKLFNIVPQLREFQALSKKAEARKKIK